MAGLMSRMSFAEFAQAVGAGDGRIAPAPATTLSPQLGRELEAIVQRDIQKRFQTSTTPTGQRWKALSFPRPGGGNKPLSNTRELEKSIKVKADAKGITATTSHPGAAVQNFGAIIRPRKGQFLAIPLTKAAQRAGSPRRMKGSDRSPLFAHMVRGRWVGNFLLVKQVKVTGREFWGLSPDGEQACAMAILDDAGTKWMGK